MKVVVSGYYGYDNVGDEAILHALISSLRAVEHEIEIVVLSAKPEVTSKRFRVQAINRWNLFAIVKAIKSADGLISGGGGLVQDVTSGKTIPYYTGIMQIAAWLKKPFVIYAQGIGPISSGMNKWLTKKAFSKASWLTVRDEGSKRVLLDIGITKPIDIVPDPVISWDAARCFQHARKSTGLQPTIAVALRKWESKNGYTDAIVNALDMCQRAGFRIVFVPMHGREDETVGWQMAERLQEKTVVLEARRSLNDKVAAIAKANVLVGMRLHSLIFAAVTAVPYVALSYDPKVEAFAAQCQQPVFAVADFAWTEDDLFTAILHQYEHVEEERHKLHSAISGMKGKIETAAERTLAVFRKQQEL